MGAQRTSQKDVLNAVEGLAGKIDSLVDVLTTQAQPAAAPATPDRTIAEEPTSVDVDKAYLAHMNVKAAEHATTKGSEVVLYARKNRAGEIKLAYALRERYDEQIARQPSNLGAVGTFQP